jgi:pimeloyl-ACP methyl ester carboxylesterase
MSERAIVFGAHAGLVGVLTEPETPLAGANRAVILSNIGMHHRIGPFRIYVEVSRRLAAAGFTVLRFDLAGMGDSAARNDAPTPSARAVRDVEDAMSWLTANCGITEFLLVGLCSGVDSTHAVAVNDARVKGAVFIDGYSYPTTGFHVRRFTVRPLQLGRWVRYVRRRVLDRNSRTIATTEPVVFARDYPTLDGFRSDVRAMTARGVRLLFVYTGGVYYRFNSPAQVFEMIGSDVPKDRVDVVTMFNSDHVFTRVADRARLVECLAAWATSVPR